MTPWVLKWGGLGVDNQGVILHDPLGFEVGRSGCGQSGSYFT